MRREAQEARRTYKRSVPKQEACFQVLDRIREQRPEVSPEEVEQDVAQAVAAVRAADVESDA